MIKVGISCGDTNEMVSKQIFQTFNEAQIFELCIPIVYGYSTALSYYHKAKGNGLSHIRTTNIHHANESIKDSLNIINTSNKTTSIIQGKTIASNMAAEESLYKGIFDLKAGEIDVFVVSPTSNNLLQQITSELSDEKKILPILINDYFRITEVSDSISAEMLTEKIEILHSVLVRDFIITLPRIAILSVNSSAKIFTDAIQNVFQRGIFCFGIFDSLEFFNSDIYKNFDAALNLIPANFTFQSIQPVNRETNVILISNSSYIVTISNNVDTLLSSAIYLAIDTYRNRKPNIYNNSLKKKSHN